MKVNKIILRDSADSRFDDLITFDNKVLLEDIYSQIAYVKENVEDYSNEDVYIALKQLSPFTIEWVGQYEIVEYQGCENMSLESCVDYNILKRYLSEEELQYMDGVINHYLDYLEKYDDGVCDIIGRYNGEYGNYEIIDWYEGIITTKEFLQDYKGVTYEE